MKVVLFVTVTVADEMLNEVSATPATCTVSPVVRKCALDVTMVVTFDVRLIEEMA